MHAKDALSKLISIPFPPKQIKLEKQIVNIYVKEEKGNSATVLKVMRRKRLSFEKGLKVNEKRRR